MTRKDHYYNKAKQEGYRSRAAYKLKQLDEEAGLMNRGDTVVDLGAAPGGWLQVAAEAVGSEGTVVGVDLQRIKSIDADNVETIRGDMTAEETKEELRERLGGGATDPDDVASRPVDLVVSDMAPNMTGEYSLDHARSVHLARQAFEVATDLLAPGGDLVVKVFDGPDLAAFREEVERAFQYVRAIHPDASRASSSEVYLVGKGRTIAPVSSGDELPVEITETGREGDGIAVVEGFTVFVAGAEEGDSVTVRVTDVKPRFAFAEVVE
ncbi:23S rRNA (uridine(2552)-2'-O)-methyltransferase [Halegenticoccus tardaugens]|uniref:23S rRNA (uridine(2552)-2'-O)-methyltransferase n=1 Tax=Halegenticoccus tardaugens TaxID=2071624 RepID=UPI00100A7BAB|nr:23S rRNA (uridine(2552)-2'-O)-methyltransferase [Halegenticoccus tardaugens]